MLLLFNTRLLRNLHLGNPQNSRSLVSGNPSPRLSTQERCYFVPEHLIRQSPEIPMPQVASPCGFDCVPPCHSE